MAAVDVIPAFGVCCHPACKSGSHEVDFCTRQDCPYSAVHHLAVDATCTSCREFSARGARSNWRPINQDTASFFGIPSSTTGLGLRVCRACVNFVASKQTDNKRRGALKIVRSVYLLVGLVLCLFASLPLCLFASLPLNFVRGFVSQRLRACRSLRICRSLRVCRSGSMRACPSLRVCRILRVCRLGREFAGRGRCRYVLDACFA